MEFILEARGISKSFGAVQALRDVDLKLKPHEILGLVGDNAAGKSTLLRIISGVHKPTEGELYIKGKRVESPYNPLNARKLGIETIYQDLMLSPNLDITSNIFLGRELKTKGGLLGKLRNKKMYKISNQVLQELDFGSGSLHTLVLHLSGGQQQKVAISRTLIYEPQVILMDEPTASLSESAIEGFLQIVRKLKKRSAIIYVSHRLTDVLSVADRIMVLRTGSVVCVKKTSETSLVEIAGLCMS